MKRDTKVLMELLDASIDTVEVEVYPLFTGEEIEIIKKELSLRGEALYNPDGSGVEKNEVYEAYWLYDICRFTKFANELFQIQILNEIQHGATFLYEGTAYHNENRDELFKWEGRKSIVKCFYSGREYIFVLEDIAENLIKNNQAVVERVKKKLDLEREEMFKERELMIEQMAKQKEMERQAIIDERELMLRIASGKEEFPRRA